LTSSVTTASAPLQHLDPLGGHLTHDAYGEAGAGERLTPDDVLRQAELLAHRPDLVFEQEPERLDEVEVHVLRQPADVCGGT